MDNKRSSDLSVLQIDNSDILEIQDASAYFDTRIIPLQSAIEGQFISSGNGDFLFLDSLILLIDRTDLAAVTLFDTTGRFKWQLKAGEAEGIGALSGIGSVEWYEDSGKLEIYDDNRRRFMYYDLEKNFLGSEPCDVDFEDKKMIKPGLFAFSTFLENNTHITPKGDYNMYSVLLVGSEGVNKGLLPFSAALTEKIQFINNKRFSWSESGIFYHRMFSDTIYNFYNDSLTPDYVIRFLHNHAGADFFLQLNQLDDAKIIFQNNHPYIIETVRMNDKIFVIYEYNTKYHFALIDISSGSGATLLNASMLKIEDQILPVPFCYKDGWFSTVLAKPNWNFLLEYSTALKTSNSLSTTQMQAMMAKYDFYKDTENPVVILFRPKL